MDDDVTGDGGGQPSLGADLFFLMFSSLFILFEKKNKTICTRNTKKRPLSFRFIHDRMKDRRGEGGTKFSLANLRVQNERNSFVISPRMNIEMGGGISAKSRLREIVHAFVCPLMMKPNTHTAQPLIRAIFPHFIFFSLQLLPQTHKFFLFLFFCFIIFFLRFERK